MSIYDTLLSPVKKLNMVGCISNHNHPYHFIIRSQSPNGAGEEELQDDIPKKLNRGNSIIKCSGGVAGV